MSEEFLPIYMVAALFALLMLGFPVAFTLGGVALTFGLIGLDINFFHLFPQRIWGVMTNFTLLAVPLFVFMGVTLERSGIAERLLESMALLLRRVRSGMPLSVIMAGALLAASTGIVGATVVTMGLIALPTMLKRGFDKQFSCGVICAAGTLGQIIPPSIVLILLGDIMGVSVGELFIAAVIPGLMLVGLYMIYSVYFISRHKEMPIVLDGLDMSTKAVLVSVATALLPPGLLIFAVLGSIFFGVASPTEAASVGAFGALVLASFMKRLTYSNLQEIMQTTTKLTCMVFTILVGAAAFGLVFRGLSGDEIITELILGFQYNRMTFLILIMVLLFILGCFLDFIEIVFIVVPVLIPIIQAYDFNMLWIAVLIAVNLQMSFLTPPFGFSLFYLKGVAPKEIKTGDIYRGVAPFVLIQAIGLALLICFPELVTWLPEVFEEM